MPLSKRATVAASTVAMYLVKRAFSDRLLVVSKEMSSRKPPTLTMSTVRGRSGQHGARVSARIKLPTIHP
jgi:hypothetical protein